MNILAIPRLWEGVGGSARTRRDVLWHPDFDVEGERSGRFRLSYLAQLKKNLLALATNRNTKKLFFPITANSDFGGALGLSYIKDHGSWDVPDSPTFGAGLATTRCPGRN